MQQQDSLEFPAAGGSHPAVYSLGRAFMAWGNLEHHLALLFAVLFALPELRTAGGAQVDVQGAMTVFFSHQSLSGKRQLILDMARRRVKQGALSGIEFETVDGFCKEAKNRQSFRNKLAHCGMKLRRDGNLTIFQTSSLKGDDDPKAVHPADIDRHADMVLNLAREVRAFWGLLVYGEPDR